MKPRSGASNLLQSSDQHVRLAAALGQFLDLQILRHDLSAEKFDVAFETRDVPIVGGGRPRLFRPSRTVLARSFFCSGERTAASGRGCSRTFVWLLSMIIAMCRSIDAGESDSVRRMSFRPLRFEIAAPAIFLDGPNRSGVPAAAYRSAASSTERRKVCSSVDAAGRGCSLMFAS